MSTNKLLLFFFIFSFSIQLRAQNSLANAGEDQLFKRGLELFAKSNYAAARQAFESYLVRGDDDVKKADARYYRAFCALSLYNRDGEKLVEEFIADNPDHPKSVQAYFELGDFYFGQKNYKKAVVYLEKADLAKLTEEQVTETRFKLGYSYFTQKKFDQADSYFTVLKRKPSAYSAAANYYAGYVAFQSGNYEKALSDFLRAEKSDAYATVVPYMIASTYNRLGRYDEMLGYIESVNEKGMAVSNSNDLKLLAAEAYFKNGQYEKAGAYFDEYLQKNKNISDENVLYRIAYTRYKTGDKESAIDYFSRVASDKDSLGFHASYFLGIMHLEVGNTLYALNAFDNARKNNFDERLKEEAFYQFAKVNYDLGRSAEATEAFEDFLQSYSRSVHGPEINGLLSQAYLDGNNYNKAIAHIEALERITPNVAKSYQRATYLKGSELFNKEDYRQATAYFEKSLQRPVDQNYKVLANYWLAEAYSVGKAYEKAIPYYQTALGNSGENTREFSSKARYGLGYAYYNSKQYDKALLNFKSFINSLEYSSSKLFYKDAMVRLADCYYVTKSYQDALSTYTRAAKLNKVDNDYVFLQSGIIYGIIGQPERATSMLQKVIDDYPRSKIYDNALFQLAQIDFEQGDYQAAVKDFSRLIRERPKSKYIPYALLRRASAYYNLADYDQTIADYSRVIREFTLHPAAEQALLPLQEALTLQGKSGEFEEYLITFRSANPDSENLETVDFETAKNSYFNQEYEKSIAALEGFMDRYPQSAFRTEAAFYTAESHYRLRQYEEALSYYDQVLNEPGFSRGNRVLNRIADIAFRNQQYDKAIFHFHQLLLQAGNKKEQTNAWTGLMESHFLLSAYDSSSYYASVLLEQGNVNVGAQNKASLYLGKSAYQKGDYDTAEDELLSTVNAAQDVYGAEAQYLLGQIFFQKGQYQQSIETLIDLNNGFNIYEDWVGRSYLLLADNYAALEDFFQAKATLQSVIENFPLEYIREEASKKLESLEESEARSEAESLALDSLDN